MKRTPHGRALLPLAAAMTMALAACGGGGGGLGGSASLSGAAIDAPIAAAQVTLTAGAPLGDPGATVIGSATANATGDWNATVALPSGSVPVFANAASPTDPALVLSSYLGPSGALAAAGALSSAELPDLEVSPVTTAALAVYAATNGNSYAGLTPTSYSSSLATLRTDVMVIAAAIKAVGDGLCTPQASITSTTNLAAAIAAAANLSSTTPTTLSAAASALGGSCATSLASLQQLIADDPTFGPELELGDVIDAGAATVPAGTYVFEAVLSESGMSSGAISSGSLASGVAAVPASTVIDQAVQVGAGGVITSTDRNVSGSLVGNLLNLVVVDGQKTYTLRGKVGALPAAMLSSGSAYAMQGGGTDAASGVLTGFSGVLASPTATPAWNGVITGQTDHEGVSCQNGQQPMRLETFVPGVGGGTLGECVSATSTSWTLNAATSVLDPEDFDQSSGSLTSGSVHPALTSPTWNEVTNAPFLLSAGSSTLTLPSGSGSTTVSGTIYYAMGAHAAVLATSSANVLLGMHDMPGLRLSESMGADGERGDH